MVKNGEIVDFYEGWIGGREFPIDMAGFAFTVKVLKEVKNSIIYLKIYLQFCDNYFLNFNSQAAKTETVGMPYSNTDQENGFLKLLNVPLKQFQPLVKQCTEVL